MAHDVFISYASENKLVADAMCVLLEAAGVRCWYAPRDILPGTAYGGAIDDAIGQTRVFVLIYSAHSKDAPHVLGEVNLAFQAGVTIIPFRIEDVPLSKNMRLYIAQTHWLDALTTPIDSHLQTLLHTIRRYLSAQTQILPGEGSDLPGAFQSAIERNLPLGPAIGRALSRVERLAGKGEVQHFEEAPGFKCCLARAAGESIAYCVRGVIYEKYMAMGGPNNPDFGFPRSDEIPDTAKPGTKGALSHFQHGSIYYHETGKFGAKDRAGDAFEVHGALKWKYDQLGGSALLGFPVSDEYSVREGRRSDFECGAMFWHRETDRVSVLLRVLACASHDAPFLHGWTQYDGLPQDDRCLVFHSDFFSLRPTRPNIAVSYPAQTMPGLDLRYGYCAITLRATQDFIAYVRVTSTSGASHYIAVASHQKERAFAWENEWTLPAGPHIAGGQFHTLIFDLRQELQSGFREDFASIHWFCFRGTLDIAGISVSDDPAFLNQLSLNPIAL